MRRTGIALGLAVALATLLAAPPAHHAAAKEMLPTEIGPNWTGDYEGMLKRRRIRVLVVSNKVLYFVDAGTQRGILYDLFSAWEKELNKGRKLPVEIVFVPVRRNELLTALVDGPRRRRGRGPHRDGGPQGARRLQRADGGRRPRDRRHRARVADARERRRPLRQGGVRPAVEQLLGDAHRAERALRARGQAAGRSCAPRPRSSRRATTSRC